MCISDWSSDVCSSDLGGKQITRIHGPFVSDDEVRAVADHWKGQGRPDYVESVTEDPEDGGFAMEGAPAGGDSAEDRMYAKACQIVTESQKASDRKSTRLNSSH